MRLSITDPSKLREKPTTVPAYTQWCWSAFARYDFFDRSNAENTGQCETQNGAQSLNMVLVGTETKKQFSDPKTGLYGDKTCIIWKPSQLSSTPRTWQGMKSEDRQRSLFSSKIRFYLIQYVLKNTIYIFKLVRVNKMIYTGIYQFHITKRQVQGRIFGAGKAKKGYFKLQEAPPNPQIE